MGRWHRPPPLVSFIHKWSVSEPNKATDNDRVPHLSSTSSVFDPSCMRYKLVPCTVQNQSPTPAISSPLISSSLHISDSSFFFTPLAFSFWVSKIQVIASKSSSSSHIAAQGDRDSGCLSTGLKTKAQI
jgi:hypothetical protein